MVVDTGMLTLKILEGDQERLRFDNIAIGRYGTSLDRTMGDNTTPLGHFTIGWISEDSIYHRFFGFSFPSREYAERAYKAGRLDKKSWNRIQWAHEAGRIPPQGTILGGQLGIHGIGRGDKKIHNSFNWTNGCVALTNEQIDRLTEWVTVGTPVEIQ